MSLFGDIGNIFHSIGHFFNGGDNQQQQQQNHPTVVTPAATPFQQQYGPQNQGRPNNAPQQPQQPQQPQFVTPAPNTVNLFQGGQSGQHMPQTGSYDPNNFLNKAPATPQPHPSVMDDIRGAIHNAPGIAAGIPLGVLRTGEGLVQGVTDLPNMAVHAATYIPRKIAGDDSAVNHALSAVNNVSQNVTDHIDAPQKWLEKKTDEAVGAYGGQAAQDAYHATQIGANVATLVPAGAALLTKAGLAGDAVKAVDEFSTAQRAASPAMQMLDKVKSGAVDQLKGDWGPATDTEVNKANTATDTNAAVAAPKPGEVAPGVTSVNPTQAEDAAAQIAQKQAQAEATSQMGQATSPAGKPGTVPDSTSPQTQAPTPPANQPPESPSLATEPAPPSGESPQTVVEPQANLSSENPPITTNNVAQTPHDVNGRTAYSAPELHDQLVKDLKNNGANTRDIKNPKHDVLSNDDLNAAAHKVVDNMSDEDLLKSDTNITDAADIARAYASIDKLGAMSKAGNPQADDVIEKLLTAVDNATSKGGRTLNYVGSMYDKLPAPAKVKYLIKSINNARRDSGLDPLSDEQAAAVDKEISDLIDKGEAAKQVISEARAKADDIADRAARGEVTPQDKAELPSLQRLIDDETLQSKKLQGDLAREYTAVAPINRTVKSIGDSAGNLARSLMLTSITGRVSDVATTSLNMAHMLSQSSIEALMGKIGNAGRAAMGREPGKYMDIMPSPRAFGEGVRTGLKKAGGNYAGHTYVDDLYKAVKTGSEGGKAQLQRSAATGPVNRVKNFAHAMAETATNLSEGLRNTKITQMAYHEGKQMGLEGDNLHVYAAARAANPSRLMEEQGRKLVEEVNNMNDNPLTTGLENLAKGFDKVPVVGEQIRNLISPFNRWVGGQAWNGITDKNAVANLGKMLAQVSFKGGKLAIKDPQEFTHQLAGLATNTAGTMGAGYALAANGYITNTNAEGYNDDGLYVHISGHYIPITFFGFAAPGIAMGAAYHQAISTPGPHSVVDKLTHTLAGTLGSLTHAYFNNTVIGGGNPILTDAQNYIKNKTNESGAQTGKNIASEAIGDAAGSYIPGIAGDVNSAINTFNIGGLNPNHEAALTKVTKGMNGELTSNGSPSTAKDVTSTMLNSLINRVPVAGQLMVPRNPGVAAQDFGSRVTRGDNESATQAKEQAAVRALPEDEQKTVQNALHKNNDGTIQQAQAAADGMTGPAKAKAQAVVDKMKFQNEQGIIEQAATKAEDAKGKKEFVESQKEMDTINGKTWANINGSPQSFDSPQKAQQAIDLQKFKDGGKDFQQKDGIVYLKGSNGKVTHMEQKDYDYKQANDQITKAKNSRDLNGTLDGQSKLLDNVQWQLNHADLTPAAKDSLISTAAKTQAEYNKYALWGGFTKPKGAPSYEPTFTGGTPKTTQYIKNIQEAGAKYGVDINAMLSVAAQEGLGGGVGDNNTSFGPFQLHEGGALPAGKDQAWAESPEGIDYAVKTIASVAKGKVGKDAIQAIVHEFEKSADPDTEAANALAVYEGGTANLKTTSGTGSSLTSSDASSSASAQKAADLIKQNNVGQLLQPQRQNFINDFPTKPVALNLPQVKLTQPGQLIKAHKITVGMPKA